MKYPIMLSQAEISGSSVTLRLKVPKEIIYFDGHFENMPVLAGVVQVDWVIQYACELLKIEKRDFKKIDQMKFTKVMLPEMEVNLFLQLKGDVLSFKYFSDEAVSSARIVFASGKLRRA